MTESRFVPYRWLSHHAIYQLPHDTCFLVRCNGCGVERDISREYLEQVGRYLSPKAIEPRFRCILCGKKDAAIIAGGWAEERIR